MGNVVALSHSPLHPDRVPRRLKVFVRLPMTGRSFKYRRHDGSALIRKARFQMGQLVGCPDQEKVHHEGKEETEETVV